MLPAIIAAARAGKTARVLKGVASGGKKVAGSAAARKVMSAGSSAGGMMGAGAGIAGAAAFGTASSLTGRLTSNLGTGLPIIAFALIVDLIAMDFILKENPYHLAMHVIVGVLMYLFIMKKDTLVLGIVALNFLPYITARLPGSEITIIIANTIANPFIPWWFIYAGFLRNRREGKIASLVFWSFVLVFLAIGYHIGGGQIAKAANVSDVQLTPDQREAAETAKEGVVSAVLKLGKDAFEGIKGIPAALMNIGRPGDLFPGLNYIWGEPEKDQPKLGIVITQAEPARIGDKVIARATLRIKEPLPDGVFLTVSDIRCWHEKGMSGGETGNVTEYGPEDFQKGINVYYGRPSSVSCEFGEEQLKGVSNVKLAVQYHVNANAKLKTYFMNNDVLENLLDEGEDPADFLGLKSWQRRPNTVYDNGPARFAIGPIELNNPPIGIKEGTIRPAYFIVTVGNRADFQGKIAKVNSLELTLPQGIELSGEDCMFRKEGEVYIASPENMRDNPDSFSDIKSERVFICRMQVADKTEALKNAEVEFKVNMDFDYETQGSLSVKVR